LAVRREPELPGEAIFVNIVRAAFARRRKTLWNNLRRTGLPEEMLDRVFVRSGIDRNRRAETLSVEEFSLLTKTWIESGADKIP
jgi:16S rRNA (adenine1518-N6/adenine1519-N6)-dimethyltransferase